MESRSAGKLPLVVIVGPTASGKTGIAIKLAKKFNGEIICADSRTVYKDMDIGTAKPTIKERAGVPHWGLDLVKPGERFTAADFKAYATEKINDIRTRKKIPFLVGGTGLYVDAVIFDYKFGAPADELLRDKLNLMSIEQLHNYCVKNNIDMPENRQNKRYVIRAIEQKSINNKRRVLPVKNSIIVGITTSKDILRKRIALRAEQLFHDGVVEEAIKLGEMYGWQGEAMTGNVYPLVRQYLANEITYQELKEKFITLDWRLAKRQLTWLRRNPYIRWLELTEVESYISNVLAGTAEA